METTHTDGGFCAGSCYKDQGTNPNNLRRVDPTNAGDYSGACMEGKCGAISACSGYFESLSDFDAQLGGKGDRSFSLWFNLGSKAGDGDSVVTFLSFGSQDAAEACTCSAFAGAWHGSQLGFIGCSCEYGTSYTVDVDEWHHMVVTMDNDFNTKVYVDNRMLNAFRDTRMNTRGSFRKFVLGHDTWWKKTEHPACNVRLDEVRVYDYALSTAQVQELFAPSLRAAGEVEADVGTYAPFELASEAKMPLHYWDFENKVQRRAACNVCVTGPAHPAFLPFPQVNDISICRNPGGCFMDLVGNSHLHIRDSQHLAPTPRSCVHGECVEVT